MEMKYLMDFAHREYRRIKCRSDLQTYKHKVPENLGLKISGISRQHTLSMLVSIRAQHSHLHQVLLPVLLSTSFVAALLLLARWLIEFLPQPIDFVSSRKYGCKPKFSKSVIFSVSDSVPDEDRDLLEDILSNKMIKK